MTRKRIPCTLSSRVIGPSSHSGSLGRVVTLGKIGPMAFFFVHGKCQHYYESGQSRPPLDRFGGSGRRGQKRIVKSPRTREAVSDEALLYRSDVGIVRVF